jgi:hypothetical protein
LFDGVVFGSYPLPTRNFLLFRVTTISEMTVPLDNTVPLGILEIVTLVPFSVDKMEAKLSKLQLSGKRVSEPKKSFNLM